MAAALEVAKGIAFNALTLAAFEVLKGDQHFLLALKNNMLAQFQNADIRLPPDDAKQYQRYAEATIEELFGRVTVNDVPLNPRSS